MNQLYKFLNEDGTPCNGGTGPAWAPPGEWMPPAVGDLVPCHNGYHLCSAEHLLTWNGPVLWTAEASEDHIVAEDKIVARSARRLTRVESWNDRNLRLFAADCAEHVLPIYLASKPEDGGLAVMLALHIVREVAEGRGDQDDLAAARNAAWDVSGNVAWAAAWTAAMDAAWAAAKAAAKAAAIDAALAAARDAALAAAMDAAWNVAWDVSKAAAKTAAMAAARAAARDTEREWQRAQLALQLVECGREARRKP